MANKKASEAANHELELLSARSLKGWIFYAMRNGRALAEAAHGNARRTAVGGESVLPYSAATIVHVASVSKLICGIAILRFIEEWNEIANRLEGKQQGETSGGARKYKGDPRPGDEKLIEAVEHWDGHISLDDRIFSFLKPHLKWLQFESGVVPHLLGPEVTGLGVDEITIRELLLHTSGLRDAYYDAGLNLLGLKRDNIKLEVTATGKAKFNLVQDCAVILANDVVSKENSYCNDGFTLLGALIEFNSGRRYEDWVSSKLTFDRRFYDIARHPVDMSRAARYYGPDAGNDGVFHPDYADFSACGGYYTSAHAICDWLDAIMQKEEFGDRPILNSPELLMEFQGWAGPGDDRFDFGPLQGFAKNGGTGVSGGSTNARVCYLKGYGNDRVAAFFQTNESADADPMLVAGLNGIRSYIYPPALVPWTPPELASHPGLRAKVWRRNSSGGVDAASMHFAPAVQIGVAANILVAGNTLTVVADRTNLLHGSSGTFNSGDSQIVELTGILTLPVGFHRLRLTSDDGSLLFIDDALYIDNDQNHNLKSVDSLSSLSFPSGGKKLKILWYNFDGGGGLYLESIRSSDGLVQSVPASCFHTEAVQFQPLDP